MMRQRFGYLIEMVILMVSLALLLGGCWSKREIEDLAIVSAIGIDYLPGAGQYRLTVQIIKPGSVRGLRGGQPGGGGGATPAPVLTISGQGETILDASRQIQLQLSRELFWAHSMAVVLGESAAREGINKLDFLVRDRQTRLSQWILVTPGTAEEILRVPPDLENIPADTLTGIIKQGTGISLTLREFYTQMLAEGDNSVAGRVIIAKSGLYEPGSPEPVRPTMDVDGVGVFRQDKLVGYLDDFETRGLMWLRNEVEQGVITVPCPEHPGENLSFRLRRAWSKTEAHVSDAGEISFTVRMELELDLDEQTCSDDLSKPENVGKAEKQVEDDILHRADKVLEDARQELRSDIFGFGEALHRSYPEVWRQVKADWNDYFSSVPVTVEVKAQLRHTGMTGQPLRTD